MPKVAVVIPAHNAAQSLAKVISGVSESIPAQDVFVVDDGSSDETEFIARELGVWVFRHVKRKGKGVSLRDGCMKALELSYEMVITMDADLQHDPAEIPNFIRAASNADVVVGKRNISVRAMPLHRFASNSITSKMLSSRTGTVIEDSQCGYRLYRAGVLRAVDSHCRYFDYESDMLLKASLKGFHLAFLPIETIYNDSKSRIRIIDIFRFIRVYLKSFSAPNGKIRAT